MAERHELDLAAVVAASLTTTTTPALPPQWHGDFTLDRARRWIADRDAESATLLALERATGSPVGLVILFETAHERAPGIDLRVGYIIVEHAWGKGLASELVEGLVEWARAQPSIQSISGGVTEDNPASARVLTKNGFSAIAGSPLGEQVYELRLSHR